jgi:glycerophosphoryl diester phosphodiesterase
MKGRRAAAFVATPLAALVMFAGPSTEAAAACGAKAFAHRGAWTPRIDENTIKSIERAHRIGAFTENDVFLTRDGRFVLVHGRSLRATTNCRGYVSNWRLARLQRRCHTTPNRMHIPSAFEAFRTLAGNRRQQMNLEVKGRGWFHNDNAKLVQLRNAAVRAGVLRRVFFSNDTTYRILTALRDSAPSARTAWKPRRGELRFTRQHARSLSVNAVMARERQLASALKVRRFQRAGFRVWATHSDRERVWRRNARRGVGAQLTNNPGAYRAWCRSRG